MKSPKWITWIAAFCLIVVFILWGISAKEPPENTPPQVAETPVSETPTSVPKMATTPDIEAIPQRSPQKPKKVLDRFTALLALNADVVGWITMPNTQVDNPVVQSGDNDFYLHRDLNKAKFEPGTLFMDYLCHPNVTDRHTVIYGHNMKDGAMFGTLKYYKQEDFYNANRTFTYSTLYEASQWEIFAAYVSTPTMALVEMNFADDTAFLKFVEARYKQSKYAHDVVIEADDQIMTLITCSYEFPDARFVIHARKITDQ